MELKHLRKGKIQTISTDLLDNELHKLEIRQAKYKKDISDNETYCNTLFERLAESGEGTNWNRGYFNKDSGEYIEIKFSDDKEEWHRLNDIIKGAEHSLKKMQKKKQLIEMELIDRTLTGH